jgi:hypothetical protein
VDRGEHEDEAMRHAFQVAPRLFGSVRGMVVQHQANLALLRTGGVDFLQEGDEVGAFVRVTLKTAVEKPRIRQLAGR